MREREMHVTRLRRTENCRTEICRTGRSPWRILAAGLLAASVTLQPFAAGALAMEPVTEEAGGPVQEVQKLVPEEMSEPVQEAQKPVLKEMSESGQEFQGSLQAEAEGSEQETENTEKYTVAIDPGHQGSWVDMSGQEPIGPGASEMKAKASTGTEGRFSGVPEYELNLEISLLLRTELEERGYEVILTREDNETAVSNSERALMAYEQGGDIFVRIHANGLNDLSVSGALAMVPSPSNPYVGDLSGDSFLLGDCILDAYCAKTGFASLDVQYYDDMTGINWSRLPVMILEMGFMTNREDDMRMADPSVQKLMAEGIADGIDSYFQQKEAEEDELKEMETGEAAAKEPET